MKTYEGVLQNGGFPAKVIVLDDPGERAGESVSHRRRYPLKLRLDLSNHSPVGFAWGNNGGSGGAQLALALLADATGDNDRAVQLYQAFKRVKITKLDPSANWTMTDEEICAWVDQETLI
jgi:hypothetical protein